MKLASRDKKLLTILGVFIFGVVYIKFLMLPKITNINDLNSQITSLNGTLSMNLVYKSKLNNTDSDIKIISKKLSDLRAIYPPSINCDELLVLIKDLSEKSKFTISKVAFDKMKPIDFVSSGEQDQQKQDGLKTTSTSAPAIDLQSLASGSPLDSKIANYFYILGLIPKSDINYQESIAVPDGKAYCVAVNLEGQGTNDQVKKFYELLKKLKNRAFFSSVNIVSVGTTENNEPLLNVKTSIEFYGIMDKGAGEYYLLPDGKWSPAASSGTTNMFKPYEGYMAGSNNLNTTNGSLNINEQEDDESVDYDFYIVSETFGGGFLPSVAIGCNNRDAKQSGSSPVVYGDKNGVENAEIFLEEKGGKFYYKIKTDHESYPDKQYSATTEFIPGSKDIKIKIVSSKRSNEKDLASVSVNIINNTKKKVTYKILYDDAKLPRVKINKTVGDVKNE